MVRQIQKSRAQVFADKKKSLEIQVFLFVADLVNLSLSEDKG